MRKYASFFEGFGKERKELHVVKDLLSSLNAVCRSGFHSPSIFSPDPPDCVCLNASNERVALEVAEVVCNRAVQLNEKGNEVLRVWEPGDIVSHVLDLLTRKDNKTFHGGPYAETLACLFTDEPMLTFEQAESELRTQSFGPFKKLTGAFLVFSYEPRTQNYPVLPLKVRHAA